MTVGPGWHGDERGHREAAQKGVAESKWEMHRRLASLKLEFLREWEEGHDLVHAWWTVYHTTLAVFWGVFALWFTLFGALGRLLKVTGRILTAPLRAVGVDVGGDPSDDR